MSLQAKLDRVARSANRQRLRDCVRDPSSRPKYIRREASATVGARPVTGRCWHGKFTWEACASCNRSGQFTHSELAAKVRENLRRP